jgi:hypothetical protein
MTHDRKSRRPADVADAAAGYIKDDQAKDEFIAELRSLRLASGAPSYRQLVGVSRDLDQHYQPPSDASWELAPLATTTISEILSGKRKGLPTFDWVASFVLSCQLWALRTGAISQDPGTSGLPRLASSLAVHAARADPSCMPPAAGAGRVGIRLTPGLRAFITSHGSYGPVLLDQASRDHPGALYRLALLLATDPAHADDATSFLLAAAANGSSAAFDLLDTATDDIPASAASRAHDLARAAHAAGSPGEAAAFYRAAARGGIPDAAIKHVQASLADHGDLEAAAWLAALTSQPGTGRHRADKA